MLILAVVSIKLVWDGGIITHAKNATSKYTIEEEKELISKGYSEYKMEKYTPEGNVEETEDSKAIKEYFLGKDLNSFSTDSREEDEKTVIIFENGMEIILETEEGDEKDENVVYLYFIYNEYRYKMKYRVQADNEDVMIAENIEILGRVKEKEIKLKVDGAEVNGNENEGWEIIFNETQNKYTLSPNGVVEKQEDIQYEVPADLETYVLGTDKMGQDIFNILSIEGDPENQNPLEVYKFKPLNGKEVKLFNINDLDAYEFYIKYDNRGYVIKLEMEGENLITKEVSIVYVPKGKEGQKVTYSYDGTKENEKEWTILYDNGRNVEIVSPDTVGDELYLGGNNTSEYVRAIKSYNEAISEINNCCSSIVKNSNKIKVRSTGSDPVNPDNENSEIVEEYYGEKIKGADENYKKDILRLSYYGILNTSNNKSYWLASRNVRKGSYSGNRYGVRCVVNGQYGIGDLLTDAPSARYDARSKSYAIRPIVKVNASSVEVIK